MNTINKILLAIALSVSLISSAFAGEMKVTGSAKASYSVISSDSTTAAIQSRQGLGISNELSFSAAGEMMPGYTWTYQLDFDQADRTVAGGGIDDSQIVITTPFGNVGLMNSEGSLRSAAYAWDVSAFGAGSDNGYGEGMEIGYELSSVNNVQYHTPAGLLPFGITAKVGHGRQDAGPIDFKSSGTSAMPLMGTTQTQGSAGLSAKTVGDIYESVTQYTVSAAPIAGLTLAVDYTDIDAGFATANKGEEGHVAAKYAAGPLTVGYGRGYISPVQAAAAATNIESYKNESYGVGFKVNSDLSVSYTEEKSKAATMTKSANNTTLKVKSMQLAYNLGGATLAVSADTIDNATYRKNKDVKEYLFTLAMAF